MVVPFLPEGPISISGDGVEGAIESAGIPVLERFAISLFLFNIYM